MELERSSASSQGFQSRKRKRSCRRHQQLALFIGQAPGPTSRKVDNVTVPLDGSAGARLSRLAGVPAEILWQVCHRRNLIEKYPGKKPISKTKLRYSESHSEQYKLHNSSGDNFPLAEARQNAASMDLSPYALVIVLGLNVARAFNLVNAKLFRRYRWEGEAGKRPNPVSSDSAWDGQTMILVFPHPSGVSHYWNTRDNRRLAQQELRRALVDTGVFRRRNSPYFLRNSSSIYFSPMKVSNKDMRGET